jgi:hypothetical protein
VLAFKNRMDFVTCFHTQTLILFFFQMLKMLIVSLFVNMSSFGLFVYCFLCLSIVQLRVGKFGKFSMKIIIRLCCYYCMFNIFTFHLNAAFTERNNTLFLITFHTKIFFSQVLGFECTCPPFDWTQ